MAKRVTENHNVTSAESDDNFEYEDMVEGLKSAETPSEENPAETPSEDTPKTVSGKKGGKNAAENVIILKNAATYSGCGLKFVKNEPTPVKDKAIYDKLLSTGLFVKG